MTIFNAPPWTPNMDGESEHFISDQLPTKYPDGIDSLGLTRWPSDWRTHRANGMTPDQAWDFVAATIDAIRAGEPTPQAPAGAYDVPWTPKLDVDGPKFLAELRDVYKQAPGGPRDVDGTGYCRWSSDYRIYRANGISHESAVRKITNDIFAIWGMPPVASGPNANIIRGMLRQAGWNTTDDDGHVIPWMCHAMSLFALYVRNPDAARRIATVIAMFFGGVRVCFNLGYYDRSRPGTPNPWVAWMNKEVAEFSFRSFGERTIAATPQFREKKEAFLGMLHELGLKIMDDRGDLNSLSREQKIEMARRDGRQYASLSFGREVLAGYWAVNEGWQNGASLDEGGVQLCVDMLNAFREGAGWLPDVCGLSAPGGRDANGNEYEAELPESFRAWSTNPATAVTCHGSRSINEHLIPHYFGYAYDRTIRGLGKKVWNTEPIGGGPGVSVGELNDVEHLCGVAAQCATTGQEFTFMSGNGVFGGRSCNWDGSGVAQLDAPLEDMPGFEEVARIPSFLPKDIATFTNVFHSGSLFADRRIVAANDPTRFDTSMHADGRFAAVVHTINARPMPLAVQRSCSEFTVIDLVTGAIERSGTINRGETFTHNGRVRLIVGRVA